MTHQTKNADDFLHIFQVALFDGQFFTIQQVHCFFWGLFFLNKFGIAVYLGTLMFYHYIHGGLSDF